ncbi:microtubule-associated protein 1A isoform X1 [Acanthochromis polyacanthus]|uniref:microtubule-associated protein 1A isoform X1 n=1 Tax=Acanthochromis polyacanthus TaxID=80966 RepID=UPI002234B1E7|nr:microtubule-associated protein 1A isoform X1 [Acanthochromis polyacanthus]
MEKMEHQDHAYTNIPQGRPSSVEFTYKMTNKEIEDLVKLRVSNKYLFSGKRNSSKWAWRAILKHMGLQHKMTHCQASKKWENMKKRYKELKSPPEGVKVFPETWPFFSLMDDAMEGRLEGNAPILKAYSSDNNKGDFLPIPKPKKRKVSTMEVSSASAADEPEIEVSVNGNVKWEQVVVQQGDLEVDRIVQVEAVEDKKIYKDSEQRVKERETEVMERERLVLQRERAVLEREIAVLDRDRALLERERATIERERATMEREKAVMERERAMVEKDRDTVCRDQLALHQEKAKLKRISAATESTEEVAEDNSEVKESDTTDRKERFLVLFEKLVKNL